MKKCALVVDDSRAMRSIVGRIVKELGFDLLEAVDGNDGLVKLSGQAVNLALVDWNMPGMNGLEFVKAVRADPRYGDLSIVMITTENEFGRIQAAIEAGAQEYVMKPFSKDILVEKLAMIGVSADDNEASVPC